MFDPLPICRPAHPMPIPPPPRPVLAAGQCDADELALDRVLEAEAQNFLWDHPSIMDEFRLKYAKRLRDEAEKIENDRANVRKYGASMGEPD